MFIWIVMAAPTPYGFVGPPAWCKPWIWSMDLATSSLSFAANQPENSRMKPMTPDPYFDLTGKITLITGGSRGLGLQMVRAFAERGADVIIASRKIEACGAAAAEGRGLA